MRRFGYGRDPLFLLGCLLYGLNRFAIKPHTHSPFLRGQFDDLLLIPCALPLILWLHRKLGLRGHDQSPNFSEVAFHVVVWSIICEAVGPRLMHVTGDFRDVFAYVAGGLAAWMWWRRNEILTAMER